MHYQFLIWLLIAAFDHWFKLLYCFAAFLFNLVLLLNIHLHRLFITVLNHDSTLFFTFYLFAGFWFLCGTEGGGVSMLPFQCCFYFVLYSIISVLLFFHSTIFPFFFLGYMAEGVTSRFSAFKSSSRKLSEINITFFFFFPSGFELRVCCPWRNCDPCSGLIMLMHLLFMD